MTDSNSENKEQAADNYYDSFIDAQNVDWEEAIVNDPRSRDDLNFLSTINKIKTAYKENPVQELEDLKAQLPPLSGSSGDLGGSFPSVKGYEIEEEIGRGGFATIYRARDIKAGRKVALKILRNRHELTPAALARFLREAHALAALRHDNIVHIYHVIDEDEVLGLSMEFIDGDNLNDYLTDNGPMEARGVAQIGADLCRALTEVHKAGYIHRDIKTENVMRDRSGRIVLMDFGLTRSTNPDSRVTETGVLVGTPLTMAPEQYEFKDVDARTDVYALGCLLYRLSTGNHVVEGKSMEELRRKVLSGDIPPISDTQPGYPVSLTKIISKAMSVKPAKRYPSTREFEKALTSWIQAHDPSQAPKADGESSEASPSLSIVFILGGILIVLVAILIFLIYLATR